MQPFEVAEEPGSQHADLAARKRDSVIGFQGSANLLPLPVADEALQPDMNHNVVADDATRRDEACQGSRPFPSPAAGSTAADRLPKTEAAMAQCQPGALPCFQHSRGPAANNTASITFLCTDKHAGNAPPALPALFFDLPDRLLQACDLRKRDRAGVFFTP